jgi:cysteine desulfurase family protein
MGAIYLDNAATTFPKPPQVTAAVDRCLVEYAVSPYRGTHSLSETATCYLEACRATLAGELVVQPSQVVFVPSATYGINTVLQGLPLKPGQVTYTSPFEHNAVARCLKYLTLAKKVRWRFLPMDRSGILDLEATRALFESDPPSVVALTHACNVTGDLLPIAVVTDLTHEYGGCVLIDAAQTVGILTPDHSALDYDFLAFSSHKGLYGIPGSGGLVIGNPSLTIDPLVYGGTGTASEDLLMPTGLPDRFEAGTHNLPSIVSMLAGVQWLAEVGKETVKDRINCLTSQLLVQLSELHEVQVYGHGQGICNTGIVSFTVLGYAPQEVAQFLSSRGVCVRSGLHCAPVAHGTLGTLPRGTVRVSPGFFNTEEEIIALVDGVSALVR